MDEDQEEGPLASDDSSGDASLPDHEHKSDEEQEDDKDTDRENNHGKDNINKEEEAGEAE